jgi:HlyD family secretion protein
LEKQRLEIMGVSSQAQLDAQMVQVEKLRAAHELKKQQVAQLTIRAGTDGVIQEVSLQVGQRVRPGDVLAKAGQPGKLMARPQIPEPQAKDIVLGLAAAIDTRNGVMAAQVSRIDPNVVNGTRMAECKLEGAPPPGAVPDLSVDGTIELERLSGVLYVGRPVFGQANAQVGLFRLQAERQGSRAGRREIGPQPGELHRGAGWVEDGRLGDPVRHAGAGPHRPYSLKLGDAT